MLVLRFGLRLALSGCCFGFDFVVLFGLLIFVLVCVDGGFGADWWSRDFRCVCLLVVA